MNFRKLIIVRNRPALYCAAFILTFFLCLSGNGYVFGAVSVAVVLIFAVLCLAFADDTRRHLRTVGLLLIFCFAAIALSLAAKCVYLYPSQRFAEKYHNTECELVLRVDGTEYSVQGYGGYNCSILMCNGEAVEHILGCYPGIRLNSYGGEVFEDGDIVFLRSVPMPPEKVAGNGFYEAAHLKSRHIFMRCDSFGEIRLLKSGQKGFIDRLRDKISGNLTGYIGGYSAGDESALAKCMLLGDKNGISAELKNAFRCAGISHILAVSGLHLSILFMVVSMIFGLGKRSPRRRFVYAETLSCIVVLFYMALADFTPSIMRAGYMLIFINLYSVLQFYRRRFGKSAEKSAAPLDEDGVSAPVDMGICNTELDEKIAVFDSVSALFCAGAVICVVSPYSVFDVGMQLSFMSTLGILVSTYVLQGFEKKIGFFPFRVVFTSLFMTLSAVSFTLPICMYNFGELSLTVFFANILAAPVVTVLLALLLVLAMLSFLPACLFGTLCGFFGMVCELLCKICIGIARAGSCFMFSTVRAEHSIYLTAVFLMLTAFTVVSLFFGLKRLRAVGFFSLIGLYFVTCTVSFFVTAGEINEPCVRLCTVYGRPYFSVGTGKYRVFFDNVSGVASESVIGDCFGRQLYDTDNICLVIPNKDSDFESALFNIDNLHKSGEADRIFLPDSALCSLAGVDGGEYSVFAGKLKESGYNIEFYGEKFTIGKVDFEVDVSGVGTSFRFDRYCAVFADEYSGEYASEMCSDLTEYGFYFCSKASETDNDGYKSGARLFVTSPLYKKIRGAEKIPDRRLVFFKDIADGVR